MQLHRSLLRFRVGQGLQFSAIWSAVEWNRCQHNASNAASLMMQPKHLLQIAGPQLSWDFCYGVGDNLGVTEESPPPVSGPPWLCDDCLGKAFIWGVNTETIQSVQQNCALALTCRRKLIMPISLCLHFTSLHSSDFPEGRDKTGGCWRVLFFSSQVAAPVWLPKPGGNCVRRAASVCTFSSNSKKRGRKIRRAVD